MLSEDDQTGNDGRLAFFDLIEMNDRKHQQKKQKLKIQS